MATASSASYQVPHGLHLAVADLVRAGMSGDVAAVEGLARRLVDEPPRGTRDPTAFVTTVQLAIDNATTTSRRLTRSFGLDSPAGVVNVLSPDAAAQGFHFNGFLHGKLLELVREREASIALRDAGLDPVSKILLSGSPGVGKTMSAHWLAGHLALPLVVLDLAQTMSSYLGESGRNVANAFARAKQTPSVFLIDEFDAVAKRRDDNSDLGELKRLVNVLLMELDAWSGDSLLVAATNHGQLLDSAVQRRFDITIDVPLPDVVEIENMVVAAFQRDALSSELVRVAAGSMLGMSNSDVTRFCRSVYRSAIVDRRAVGEVMLERLAMSRVIDRTSRDELWRQLADELGMSARTIAKVANVAHPTVSSGLRRARGLHGATK